MNTFQADRLEPLFSQHGTDFIVEETLSPERLIRHITELGVRPALIVDEKLLEELGEPLFQKLQSVFEDMILIACPCTEAQKSRQTKAWIEDQLLDSGYTRDSVLVAIGGGIITDLVGFTAATYCRGIPVIYCPTTTLAIMDAAIGGKTGLNTTHSKNMIGAFYHPTLVYIGLNVLDSLPFPLYQEGLAELIKHALIADANLYGQLMKTTPEEIRCDSASLIALITASIRIKLSITEGDPKEAGKRAWLNLGHTIGHALEMSEQLSHGSAVAFGIAAETWIAVQRKYCSEQTLLDVLALLERYGFAMRLPTTVDPEAFLGYLRLDKKNKGQTIQCALLKEIGEASSNGNEYTYPLSENEALTALAFISG